MAMGLMDLLPPSALNLVFDRDSYMAYSVFCICNFLICLKAYYEKGNYISLVY